MGLIEDSCGFFEIPEMLYKFFVASLKNCDKSP